MSTPGQRAYEAYCHTVDFRSIGGARLPAWEDQYPRLRDAWEMAAAAARGVLVVSDWSITYRVGSGNPWLDHNCGWEWPFPAVARLPFGEIFGVMSKHIEEAHP